MKVNEEARETLWNTVEGISDDDLNWKPAEDRWSIRQVMEHIHLMEGAVAKTIQAEVKKEAGDPVAEKPIERTVDRSTKVEAPGFAVPGDSFMTKAELRAKLDGSHQLLRQTEESIPAEELEVRSYPHPVFGEMNLTQWIPFAAYHELRHIDQIKEVAEELDRRP
ncbi:hypothetical protein NCCP2716_26680 [Sporosarcina sp. NCCP-2716]|uniref:DinB family protein n=1 Tax=Sporosarcina sp. NCCP-2716 TaxID=2943679 RepID=UPI00203C4D3F|nr:DinB family protein [Sporosarcina sp. NCCP-2716]GKV70170.1 hypothetical protein NCCP2716_26680 [Sporosarcina sp. NCCP-2716]